MALRDAGTDRERLARLLARVATGRRTAFGEIVARALELARLNSRFETGIKSPLDAAILAEAGAPGAIEIRSARGRPA